MLPPTTSRQKTAVVSFHPLFTADMDIICAGRLPDASDLHAIRSASAVILPQGCPRQLYEMARANCPNVFPNYDTRFRYVGKIGQIRLFRETATPHPETDIFLSVAEFSDRFNIEGEWTFPLVFKFDWGGEGDTVSLVHSYNELANQLKHAARYEASGQKGFLLQKYIPTGNRSLRVAVIGDRLISYWRILDKAEQFHANVSKGAKVDSTSHPGLKQVAEAAVAGLCRRVAINLAGFDVIFAQDQVEPRPLLLEINYFFGRTGLGGSEKFYRILRQEIRRWLKGIGL
jgi:ribosomal protein S6--L-glutamate ligase